MTNDRALLVAVLDQSGFECASSQMAADVMLDKMSLENWNRLARAMSNLNEQDRVELVTQLFGTFWAAPISAVLAGL